MLGTGFFFPKAQLGAKAVPASKLCPSVADAGATPTPFSQVYLKIEKKYVFRQTFLKAKGEK